MAGPTKTVGVGVGGYQLPDANIVHQVPQTDPPPMPYQPRIRRWVEWAERAGPKLNPAHRLVLNMIATFADEEGEAIVSQEILAYLCDLSRTKVIDVIKELRRHQHIAVRKEPRSDGRYEYNVYRLAAAEGRPAAAKGTASKVMTSTKMVATLSQAVTALLELVEAQDLDVELAEVESAREIVDLLQQGDMDTRERETYISMSTGGDMVQGEPPTPDPNDVKQLENESFSPSSVRVTSKAAEIDQFVRDAWSYLEGRGWRHRGGAQRVFKNDLEQYEDARRDYEQSLSPSGSKYSPDLWKPQYPDARRLQELRDRLSTAEQQDGHDLWLVTLETLKTQLPRPIFETWLSPTNGLGIIPNETGGEVLLVECPTQYHCGWLERRMFLSMQRTLDSEAGRGLPIQLTIREPQRNEGDEEGNATSAGA